VASRETRADNVLVTVNKKPMNIPDKFTLMDLLNFMNYSKSVAVFINGKQLLQVEYEKYNLKENDNIRIIKPLGGG